MTPPDPRRRLLNALLRRIVRGTDAEQIRLDLEELFDRDRARGVSRPRSLWRLTRRTVQSTEWTRSRAQTVIDGREGLVRRVCAGALHDLADAVRSAARVPAVSAVIVGTLAIGLTLVAASFSAYSAVFLQRDDIPNPDVVFEVRRPTNPGSRAWMPFTRPQLQAMRTANIDLAQMAGVRSGVRVRSGGNPLEGTLVTGNFFSLAGVSAYRGRTIVDADDQPGNPRPVVVLGHAAWRRLFQSDDAVIGQTITLNGAVCHIVGVMPPNFRGLSFVAPEFWAPLGLSGALQPALRGKDDEAPLGSVIARLEPDVNMAQAEQRLTAWVESRADVPALGTFRKTIQLVSGRGADPLEGLPWFVPLFLTFGLILIIGASNVSNLYLARGLARQKELAIRSALGASRRRLVFLLTVDGFVLALVASVIAAVVAEWLLNVGLQGALTNLVPENGAMRAYVAAPPDWRLMIVLVGCSIVVTMVSALGPALRVTRHVAAGTNAFTNQATQSSGKRRFLMTVQVTSSVVLLVVSALLLQGAKRAAEVDVTVRVDDTLFVGAPQPSTRNAVIAAVRSTPGVTHVASASGFGFGGELAEAAGAVEAPVEYRLVSPEYFSVLDIPVVRGRSFAESERDPSTAVAIVSTIFAQRLWPDAEPVGQVLTLRPAYRPAVPREGHADETPQFTTTSFTVVGVVPQVHIGSGMFEQHDAGVYLPADITTAGMSFVVRVAGDPDAARRSLFDQVDRVEPSLRSIMTVRQMVNRSRDYLRAVASLTLFVGAIALVLMAAGLSAVMSHMVTHRRQEIGIRLALGATTRDIAQAVYAPISRPIGIGVFAGAALAWWAVQALSKSPLFAPSRGLVQVNDLTAFVAGCGAVVLIAILACVAPAARATRVDPLKTLRQE